MSYLSLESINITTTIIVIITQFVPFAWSGINDERSRKVFEQSLLIGGIIR